MKVGDENWSGCLLWCSSVETAESCGESINPGKTLQYRKPHLKSGESQLTTGKRRIREYRKVKMARDRTMEKRML